MGDENIHIMPNEELEKFLCEDCMINFEWDYRDKIEDLGKFIRELENQSLLTKDLETFIENYVRFEND